MRRKIFYGWWIVTATNIICMLGFGTWLYCFGVFFKPMMSEFGWTRAMTAAAYSFRGIQGGFAAPVVGWAVDKYGPRIVVFIGGVIAGLGFILMCTINSLVAFYMIYGILLSIGMSAMLYIPAMTAIANWFVRMRSRALSILAVGAGIGGFVCAPAAAVLITRYGWRVSFVVMGITIWVVVLPLSLILRKKPEDIGLRPDGDPPAHAYAKEAAPILDESIPAPSPERDWTLRQALASRTYYILAFAFFLAAMTHATVIVHAVPALTDAGISPERAAFSIGLATLLSIIGRLLFGWLGDFLNKRYLFMVTYSIEAVGVLVLMNAHAMGSVYLFAALFGIGFGGTIPLNPAIRGQYFGRAAFGKIQGSMAPIMMMGSVLGPPFVGHLFDSSGTYRTGFLIIALLQFFAAVTIFFARPTKVSAPKDCRGKGC
ncbi:MAG: MFS transporter [Candidatus Hydrogenedentota bacterium]|nr:MAG: MFS transporter [Candidatus Hydrogenedentota bacterium]